MYVVLLDIYIKCNKIGYLLLLPISISFSVIQRQFMHWTAISYMELGCKRVGTAPTHKTVSYQLIKKMKWVLS